LSKSQSCQHVSSDEAIAQMEDKIWQKLIAEEKRTARKRGK